MIPSTTAKPHIQSDTISRRSNCVKWLKDHPYISIAIYFVAVAALGVFLAYIEDLSLSKKLIIGCVTGSLLTISFVPFGCLYQTKKQPLVSISSPVFKSPNTRLSKSNFQKSGTL